MNKKTVKDMDIAGKRIIHRVAYDVSLKDKDGQLEVVDDLRLKVTIPTINYLLEQDCKIILLSWLKRPDGKVVEKWKMDPVAKRLSELLGKPVKKLDDCVGQEVEKAVAEMKPGEIIMLENVRFHPEEMTDEDEFASQLASLGDIMVQDAFAQVHRVHASITGIPRHIQTIAGLYLEKEIDELSKVINDPKKPLVVIIGGAKVSDKIDAINNLVNVADTILIGGGVANNFIEASGKDIGNSYIEDVYVDKAKKKKKDFLELSKKLIQEKNIQIPLDMIAVDSIEDPKETKIINLDKEKIPDGWAFVDIGPETQKLYNKILSQSKTIFWNGPLGVFENKLFAEGTKSTAKSIAKSKATSVIGGGETIAAIRQFSSEDKFTHISVAGGATLEFIAGKKLPGIEAIANK
jgi:3-phosphoglycerate kinase